MKNTRFHGFLPFILRGPSDVKNRLERLAERLTADRELITTRENIPVILAGRIFNAIRAQVFKQPSRSRIYSSTELFQIYNTAVKEAGESLRQKEHYNAQSFGVVLRRFEALFEVDCSEKNKYQIGSEITAKSIFNCPCSEKEDLTTRTIEST
jgi:hypothetical protein